MGLAASQTRFLTLTARKSNIEFQGQQINQQRTVLANQSSDLYSRMLELQVPVPPSMTNGDYYNVSQEFYNPLTGLNTELVSNPSLVYNDNGTDTIAFQFTTAYTENGVDKQGSINSVFTTVGATDGSTAGSLNEYLVNTLGTTGVAIPDAASLEALTDQQRIDVQQALIGLGIMSVDNQTGQVISSVQLDLNGDKGTSLTDAGSDGIYQAGDDLQLDNTDMAFGTHFDNDGFDDASREYEYSKFVYDKALADINAETESIFQKDKMLELKLKQLDSEHTAIQTEMEAVKKVIDKNIDGTFKIFGG